MSINTYRPAELALQRKIASDNKNKTDDFTFKGSEIKSSHGRAYKKVRIIKDDSEINRLANQSDEDYFNELGSDF